MLIFKHFYIDSAHKLKEYPKVHGHSYKVTLWLFRDSPVNGYIIEEAKFQKLVDEIREELDHTMLNEIIEVPTSENLAIWIYEKAKSLLDGNIRVQKVRVYRSSCSLGVEYNGR